MGDAVEVFNPVLAHSIARAMGASSLDEYVGKILRARNTKGVFGAELTWPHLLSIFKTERRFLQYVEPSKFIWLRRQDIVAQAVSVMAMVQSGVAHAKSATKDDIQRSRDTLVYDQRHIRRIVSMLAWSERNIESFFQAHQVEPLRMTYEQMMATPTHEIVQSIADHLGVKIDLGDAPESGHKKLSGSRNSDFADRFRTENASFVRKVEQRRVAGS